MPKQEQIIQLAAKTPALHVRGKVLVHWAKHLSAVYKQYLQMDDMLPSGAVLEWWNSVDGVPEQWCSRSLT